MGRFLEAFMMPGIAGVVLQHLDCASEWALLRTCKDCASQVGSWRQCGGRQETLVNAGWSVVAGDRTDNGRSDSAGQSARV